MTFRRRFIFLIPPGNLLCLKEIKEAFCIQKIFGGLSSCKNAIEDFYILLGGLTFKDYSVEIFNI